MGSFNKTQIIDIKDYGAKGDGVTNDGPALRAALSAAAKSSQMRVFVPAGTYVIKEPDERG